MLALTAAALDAAEALATEAEAAATAASACACAAAAADAEAWAAAAAWAATPTAARASASAMAMAVEQFLHSILQVWVSQAMPWKTEMIKIAVKYFESKWLVIGLLV